MFRPKTLETALSATIPPSPTCLRPGTPTQSDRKRFRGVPYHSPNSSPSLAQGSFSINNNSSNMSDDGARKASASSNEEGLSTDSVTIQSASMSNNPPPTIDRVDSPDLASGAPSTLPSGATTPALPDLTFPPKVQEAISLKSPGTAASSSSTDAVIIGIAVVDFNHLVGPQVEYAHPKELLEDEELCGNLPFLALPDGSHLSDEDFCYFHLTSKTLHNSTIFGISCNRQIASSQLTVKGKEVTRSTVQKAVVVLARDPVFGPIKEKLGVVTRAFFAQANFGDVDILIEFHATLEAGLRSARVSRVKEIQCADERMTQTSAEEVKTAQEQNRKAIEERETVMYMGTSLRELIYKWRFKTLMLLKLLILQKKVSRAIERAQSCILIRSTFR